MLSIVHASKKFHPYIFGKEVTVQWPQAPRTDSEEPPLAAQMRVQRTTLNLQWYELIVQYHKGKEMYLPDTLSRAYRPDSSNPEISDLKQVSTLDFLSITKDKYTELQEHSQRELNQLQTKNLNGWRNIRQEVYQYARIGTLGVS